MGATTGTGDLTAGTGTPLKAGCWGASRIGGPTPSNIPDGDVCGDCVSGLCLEEKEIQFVYFIKVLLIYGEISRKNSRKK